jgi:hypothetical protein
LRWTIGVQQASTGFDHVLKIPPQGARNLWRRLFWGLDWNAVLVGSKNCPIAGDTSDPGYTAVITSEDYHSFFQRAAAASGVPQLFADLCC